MTWDEIARRILAGATSSGVAVDRALVAPGPDFAHDCRLLAVHLAAPQIVPAGDAEFARFTCAWATQLSWRVTFVADCVPGPDDNGDPPSAAAITSWSTSYLADVGRIHAALEQLTDDETLGDPCSVQLGDGLPAGPSGGAASTSWTLSVLDTTPTT